MWRLTFYMHEYCFFHFLSSDLSCLKEQVCLRLWSLVGIELWLFSWRAWSSRDHSDVRYLARNWSSIYASPFSTIFNSGWWFLYFSTGRPFAHKSSWPSHRRRCPPTSATDTLSEQDWTSVIGRHCLSWYPMTWLMLLGHHRSHGGDTWLAASFAC